MDEERGDDTQGLAPEPNSAAPADPTATDTEVVPPSAEPAADPGIIGTDHEMHGAVPGQPFESPPGSFKALAGGSGDPGKIGTDPETGVVKKPEPPPTS